jgi:hypothetical protein
MKIKNSNFNMLLYVKKIEKIYHIYIIDFYKINTISFINTVF